MKTVGFRDIVGGGINCYVNKSKPKQKRMERFFEGLEELRHTGNIVIYRIEGNKAKKLKVKRY